MKCKHSWKELSWKTLHISTGLAQCKKCGCYKHPGYQEHYFGTLIIGTTPVVRYYTKEALEGGSGRPYYTVVI